MNIDQIIDRLDCVRHNGGGRYQARCPAHDDKDPSLSVKVLDSGKISIKCWAGCDIHSIMHAIGYKVSDLYPDDPYWQACRRPLKSHELAVDESELDKTIIAIAQADLAKGKQLSLKDRARLDLALKRIEARSNDNK